jgi:hypothetical protein
MRYWIALFLLLTTNVYAEYQVPDLTGYEYIKHIMKDKDSDGIKETRMDGWKNVHGHRVIKYSKDGIVYGWAKQVKSVPKGDLDNNYCILDTDCDGIFDTKIGPDEGFGPPECLK